MSFRRRNHIRQLLVLINQFCIALALFLPPKQQADQLLLPVDIDEHHLMDELGPDMRRVDLVVLLQHSILLQCFANPFAHELGVRNSRDGEGALVESMEVRRGELVCVEHVAAEGRHGGGFRGAEVIEHVRDHGIEEFSEGEARAAAFARHCVALRGVGAVCMG
jgi:hypothetical protein